MKNLVGLGNFDFECFGFTLRREPKLPTWQALLEALRENLKKV